MNYDMFPIGCILNGMIPSGYSGTPLYKKLGLKAGHTVLFVNPPQHYLGLLQDGPETVSLKTKRKASADFIQVFCRTKPELERNTVALKPVLHKKGMFWVCWPKGSSAIVTDLSRDFIRNFLLDQGLVDVKICAIDADWSALKFVYRLKDRK